MDILLYRGYETYADTTQPLRTLAYATATALRDGGVPQDALAALRHLRAASELMALGGLTHERPPFGIDLVDSNGHSVAVREEVAWRTPFMNLVRFRKEGARREPAVLLVAPLSGHFATLLRGTAKTLIAEHDVYVTDWCNVRDVSLAAGTFDLDRFIDHIIDSLAAIGPAAHVIAVCQPTVAVLAAIALMAANGHRAQPASMTLMAGPIDTRVNPTRVNALATSKPIEWFERNLIGIVPLRYLGAARLVYPGFLQIASFMSMNLDRHRKAFDDLYHALADGDVERAEPILSFYHEYFATMDLPAEFYLQTVRAIFQDALLPRGLLAWRGQKVEPEAIRRTALFTVEGEKDDICAVGQTLAAQDLCTGLPPYLKTHHVQTGAGHYGVFNGRRWESSIYPRVRELIQTSR